MYKVYLLRDKNRNIVYVGYTSRSLHNRWRSHKNVYPERAHLVIELIQEVESKEQAKSLEVLYQKQYNTVFPNGLNVALGHVNHDGTRLIEPGRETRFGNRVVTPAQELKRKKAAKAAIAKVRKPVRCLNTGLEYASVTICAKALGLSKGNLSQVLSGKRPNTKGLRFEFIVPN